MKFFRIITTDITTRSELRLPRKFVKRYGVMVPGNVSLEVPTGSKWRVEVKKKNDEVWLGKGWFEFAGSLGIKCGHFLIFDYDAMHAVFYVVSIGMTAAETEYPAEGRIGGECHSSSHGLTSASTSLKVAKEVDYQDDDDDVVIVKDDDVVVVKDNDANLGRKRRNGTQAPFCEYPRKAEKARKSRKEDGNMSGYSPIVSKDEKSETGHTVTKKGKLAKEIIFNSNGNIQCVVQGRRNQTISEKNLAEAKSFKTDEPVCIITVQPSYVVQETSNGIKKKCRLLFPLCFTKAYFNLKTTYATLRTNDGKSWSMKYRIAEVHQRSYFTYGWRQFAMNNDLKAGDVCLFELIRGVDNSMNVVIFRYWAPASASKCLKVEEEEDQHNDDDVVILKDDNANLGRKRRNGTQALCEYPRKTAKASISRNADENMDSPKGFKDGNAETGETTIKKGTLGTEIIFNREGRIQRVVQGSIGRRRNKSHAEKVLARAKAKSFKAEEPVFIIVMQPSYVMQEISTGAKMYLRLPLPLCFIKAYFNLKIMDVMLRTNDGMVWSMKYRLSAAHKQSFFTTGWKQFAIDNNLKVGDICLFELIRGAENAMKVFIFRSCELASASKCLKVVEEEDDQVDDDDDVIVKDDDANLGSKSSGTQARFCESSRMTGRAPKSRRDDKKSMDSPIGPEYKRAETSHTTMKKGRFGKEIILNGEGRIQCVVQGRRVKNDTAEKAVARAKTFSSKEPVCIIAMQPSHVMQEPVNGPQKYCRLHLPLCFIEAYFNLRSTDVTLKTNNGKTSSVTYRLGPHMADFTTGWSQFAMDNDLKVGDVCLFELIRGVENALQVAIFRAVDELEAGK